MTTPRKKFIKLLNSSLFKDDFTAQFKAEMVQKYQDSIGLGKGVTFSPDALNKYSEGSKKSYKDFTKKNEQKQDVPTEFKQKMDAVPQVGPGAVAKDTIATAIKDALAPKDLFTQAKNNYALSIEAFKELAKKVPEKYDVANLRAELDRNQGIARKAIQFQQKKELEQLETNLKVADIKAAFGVDDDDADRLRKEVISDLKASQKTQLDQFNKSAKDSLTQIDTSSANEMNDFMTGVLLRNFALNQTDFQKRKEMLAELERVRKENLQARGITEADELTEATVDVGKNTISSTNPKNLNFAISSPGSKITQDKTTGTWTVQLNHRIFDPLYYLSNKDSAKVDMMTMAALIRQSGHDKITMKISFADEETFKLRVRQAYEACLETGFDPKNVFLKDGSGEPIDITKYIGPRELQKHKENAKVLRDELAEIKPTTSKEHTANLKQQLADFRQQARPGEHVMDVAEEQQMEAQLSAGNQP